MSRKKPQAKIRKRYSLAARAKLAIQQLRLPLLLIFIALLPRLIVLTQLSDSPVFEHPMIDGQVYHQTAREIASGNFIGQTSFWQAPLYPYFLALLYMILGVSVVTAKVAQVIIGAINCYLVFVIAGRLFDRKVAYIAYALAALYGPFIFFETEIMAPVLLNLILLSMFLILMSYLKSPSVLKIVSIGILLALGQLSHGLVAIFVPLLIGWLVYQKLRHRPDGSFDLKHSGYLLIAFLVPIFAVTVRNYAVDRQLVLVSSNFGANFYLGNHPHYDSTVGIRPGLEWDEFVHEATQKGYVKTSEMSRYFTDKAVSFITGDPVGFLQLLLKKFYLLLAGEEIKRNLDIYHFKQYSLLLDLLIWYKLIAFPTGIILPIGVVWILLYLIHRIAVSQRREVQVMLLLILSQALGILLFFVSSRYRLVLMPFVMVLAAALIGCLVTLFREKKWRQFTMALLLTAPMLIFSNLPRITLSPKDLAENAFYEGSGFADAKDWPRAREKYEEAVRLKPDYEMAKLNLAMNLFEMGDKQAAERLLEEIITENPRSFVASLQVGKVYYDHGEKIRGEQLFRDVLAKNRYSAEGWVNLGAIFRERGQLDSALFYLNKALEVNPRSFLAYNQIGALYLQQNNLAQAEENFRQAYNSNHSYLSAMNNLALIYTQTNRLNDAEGLLSQAVCLDPEDVNSLINYGAILMKKTKPGEALEYFERAAKLSPDLPQSHHYRGVALLSLGRTREGREALLQALKLNPNFQPSREQLEKLGK